MAAVNKTRDDNNFQKRSMSLAYIKADYTDIIANAGQGTIFFSLPPNSILVHVAVIEETAANTGANITITAGPVTVLTNGVIDASAIITMTPKHYEVGGDFIIKQGSVPPTQGSFSFMIIYCEHDKHTGEYTRYSET